MTDRKARIVGMGAYLPEKVLTNSDLEKMVDTTDEWILTRTGMRERRIAASDEFTSDMAVAAAKKALAEAGITPSEVDLIMVATLTPDYVFPSTAALVQKELGAQKAAALDIQAACTGFLYGLSLAKGLVESGIYGTILLIASEKLSSIVNYQDRGTCILFGDGAAAAVIRGEGRGLHIKQVCLGADGEVCDLIIMPGGGCRHPTNQATVEQGLHYIRMEGKETFKHAVRRMEAAAKECLEKADMQESDIDWLVPHQANKRIIDAIAKRFSIADEKVYLTVHKYGNTSASALPIALHELLNEKEIKEGDNLLLVAFGAGLTWGSTILCKEGQ